MIGGIGTRELGKQHFERQMKDAGLICQPISRHRAHYIVRDPSRAAARPISVRLTTSSNETFSLYPTTKEVGLLVYLWVRPSGECKTFALTYDEAHQIMREKGYTETYAWKSLGGYSVTHSGLELKEMLRSFLMSREKWRDRIKDLSE
jgi:hypothetical protein